MANKKLLYSFKIVGACLLVISAIGFVEKKHHNKLSQEMDITILNQEGNYFISKDDIKALVFDASTPLIGQNVPEKVLHDMEQRLMHHKFIERAQVYKNLKGKLVIQVHQSVPMARILRQNQPDAYITKDGEILPTSDKHAARVPLVSGSYMSQMIEDGSKVPQRSAAVLSLLQYIDNHDFWKAQVAQLDINEVGEIIIYPQVGRQYIEFGAAEDIESKFQRLDLFYKKILPKEGWNTYSRVNVQYRDQIICE